MKPKYIVIIVLALIAGLASWVYFTLNQPQDLGPIVVNHKAKNDSVLQIWDDGTAYVKGEVVDNITGCEVDGVCKLIVQAQNQKVTLVYAGGDIECPNTQAASWVQWGKNVNIGTMVKAYGAVKEVAGSVGPYLLAYELTFCDSKDYFILGADDPVPVGPYTEKFFDEVAKRKHGVAVDEFLQAKQKGNWQTYRDDKLGYEFSYPATWMPPQSSPDAPWSVSYYDYTQEAGPAYSLTLGFITEDQLNHMGVTFCGPRPKDPRCQSLSLDTARVMIDWGNDGVASAWISLPQGGVLTFELKPVTEDSKAQFLSILKTFKFTSKVSTLVTAEPVLFEQSETWGPCLPAEICRQSTALYRDGKLVLAGNKTGTKILSSAAVEQIRGIIRSSDILNKDCAAQTVFDYGAAATIYFDGKIKLIHFPGCQDDIEQIKKVINQNN